VEAIEMVPSRAPSRRFGSFALALFVVAAAQAFLAGNVPPPAEAPVRRVLVLQSYHVGDMFADSMRRGVMAALERSGLRIEPFLESLDSNRVRPLEPYTGRFEQMLREKYAHTDIEVVVACDNDALDFLRVRRNTLFPAVPVVFVGVNEFSPSMLDGRWDVTGVAGNRDMLAAAATILRVRPGVKRIYAIVDDTVTGRAERQVLTAAAARLPAGVSLRFLSLGEMTLEQLGDRLAALGEEDGVLLVHASVDRDGRAHSGTDTTPYLGRRSAVPVFVVSDTRVGLGALGGLVASGREAGLAAGEMVVSILEGTPASRISVVQEGPTRFVFDYDVMQRFGIDLHDLPAGSDVLNRPRSILEEHRSTVLWAAAAFVVVTLFVVLLALEVLRRRRVEASLRKSQATLAGILDSVPQGVFWRDRDGVYRGCNEVFATAVGLPDAGAIVGKTNAGLAVAVPGAWSEQAIQAEVLTKNQPTRRAAEPFRRADEETRWVDTMLIPLEDEHGNVHGILGVYDDVTERRQAEEERAKLLDQLQQAAKMEAVGRLAGGVAHDFNNLLTAIMGNIELAREELDAPATVALHLDEAGKAADSAASLTRQLLAFSRKQMIEPKIIDLNELIGRLQNMLGRLIGEHISLRVEPARRLDRVKVDPGQFEQVLVNLVVNARDAMPSGGSLVVGTANVRLDEEYCASHPGLVPGDYVRLTVTDTGVGMTEEVKSRLFEPFFTTKAHGRGTGLGLATAFGAVAQMSGSIEVQSELGRGTTFVVHVPRAESQGSAGPSREAPERALRGSERVLLVEDDPGVRRFTVEMLERLGYAVCAASDATEALKLAGESATPFDILITDVVMPGMNGAELAQRLVALHPGLKVLLASGYTESAVLDDALAGKRVNFITKPYSIQAMAAKIRQVLEGADRTP
jgi:PAS domain S-box-containing protein